MPNAHPRAGLGNTLPESYESFPSNEQNAVIPQEESLHLKLSTDIQVDGFNPVESIGLVDSTVSAESTSSADSTVSAESTDSAENYKPTEGMVPFDVIVQAMTRTQFISYIVAVRKAVNALTDDGIRNALTLPGTSLLTMCQIAGTCERAKNVTIPIFNAKYADCTDFTDDLNEWNSSQVKRFFELFGPSMVSLDVCGAYRPGLVLGHIAANCINLTELRCIIAPGVNADKVRPLFSRLRKLNIVDGAGGMENFILLNPFASVRYLTIECCSSMKLPPVRMPRLVELDVWFVEESHVNALNDSLVPFMEMNPQLRRLEECDAGMVELRNPFQLGAKK